MKKLQIKTVGYHHISIRMVKIQNTNVIKCKDMEKQNTAGENARWYSQYGEKFGSYLWMYFYHMDPTIALLVIIYPNKLKTHPHKNLHVHNCQNLETTKKSFCRGMKYSELKEMN